MGVIIQKIAALFTTTDIACANIVMKRCMPIACCITSTPVSINT